MVSFAVLAAIVVVAGFMAIQLSPRPAVPVFAVDYGPPPTSVQLIWVQHPNHPGWLIGFDWTGKPRGTAKISQPIGQYDKLSQAPDGSAFAYEPNAKGGFQVFFDGMGNPIASSGPSVRYQSEMWADDSRHLCSLDGSGGHWRLGVSQPGEAPDHANVVALDPAIAQSGIIALSLAACGGNSNGGSAVIEYSYASRPTEYWVVRISDGAILQQRTYPADQVENVTASMDGSLIAENSGVTVIRRASDLSLITRLDPTVRVLAFSGDDSSVLVSAAPLIAGQPAMQEVLDSQTGRVIWRGKGTFTLSSFAVQPGGNAFAVALTDGGPPATILIVYGDGSRPAILPGLLTPIW